MEDVKKIAPFYGVEFSADLYPSKESVVTKANSILTSVDDVSFGEIAKSVSFALWEGDEEELNNLCLKYQSTDSEVQIKLQKETNYEMIKAIILARPFIMKKSSIGVLIVCII